MKITVIAAMCVTSIAAPSFAQDRWATFANDITARQGAFICSEMNEETGDFFCMELACDAGAPLSVEFSYDGSRMEEVVEASFVVNGIHLGGYAFQKAAPSGYALYSSSAAAQDEQLRYWLRNGRSAEIAIGDEVQVMSLAGSSAALNHVLAACPIG